MTLYPIDRAYRQPCLSLALQSRVGNGTPCMACVWRHKNSGTKSISHFTFGSSSSSDRPDHRPSTHAHVRRRCVDHTDQCGNHPPIFNLRSCSSKFDFHAGVDIRPYLSDRGPGTAQCSASVAAAAVVLVACGEACTRAAHLSGRRRRSLRRRCRSRRRWRASERAQ